MHFIYDRIIDLMDAIFKMKRDKKEFVVQFNSNGHFLAVWGINDQDCWEQLPPLRKGIVSPAECDLPLAFRGMNEEELLRKGLLFEGLN
jgi:hypothetical protein